MKVISSFLALTAAMAPLPLSLSFTVHKSSSSHVAAPMPKTTATSSPSSLAMSSSPTKKSSFDISDYLSKFDVSSLTETASSAMENTMAGDVGQRGEVYTAAQFAAMFAILVGGIPLVGDVVNVVLGPVLFLVGLAVCVLSITDLGTALSPWPKAPPSTTELVTDGLYAQVRHPLYAGNLALFAGIAVWSGSADRLLFTALLWYILDVKTNLEEDDLVRKFPEAYPAYQEQVTNKFVPQSVLDVLPWNS